MNKVKRISSLRAAVSAARKGKKTIGFVPTMGNLHQGHLALVKAAKQRTEFVVVSIYINPTQFGDNEDLDNYPSTPEEDARQLAETGADLLFLPDHECMYPGEIAEQTFVHVPLISDKYCGTARPEHFQGVTTVVCRLFNMVQPDVAVFGKKDYQQLTIIKNMVRDLAYPIQVIGVDTIRAESGLALSSRNTYLTKSQFKRASQLYRQINLLAQGLKNKSASIAELEKLAINNLELAGFKPQYITVCRQLDLLQASAEDKELVILAAAIIGKARLIDNLEVDLAAKD